MAGDQHGAERQHGDTEQSLQRTKRGVIWARAGRLTGVVGLALVGWQESDPSLLGLGGAALIWAGLWSYIRGKRLQSMPAQTLMALDQRPPVLYLRSFKDDKAAAVRPRPLGGVLGLAVFFFGVTTEEEQLAEAVDEIGPFVAIGKPGEKLPELGASRMYVSDAEWQNRISALMSRAQLVILRAGDTEGFWWEVKHVAENMAPERLIFLLPFKKDKYTHFCNRAETLLPCRLPEYQGAANLLGSRLRAMLYFDRDWTPHIRKLGILFNLSLTPLVMPLKKAMRPIIERLPSDARQTPVRRRRGFAFLRTIPVALLALTGIPALSSFAGGIFSSVAHNNRGLTLYEQNDLYGAIREYERALRLNPNLVSAYSNLGMAWYQKGDFDRALTEYGKGLRLDQNVAALRNNVGLALLKKGNGKGAIAEFQVAVRIDPTLVGAHENLCDTLYGQNILDEAVAECRVVLRLNPSSANAHYVLGDVARQQGDFAGAIGYYREALRLSPTSALAHNNLGWTLAETGKAEEAMTEYREAIRLEPDFPEAHMNLANALAANGDWADATIEFRTALRLLPNAGFLHYNLGLALDRQGEYASAREEFVKAYELAPEDPKIRRKYQQITRR